MLGEHPLATDRSPCPTCGSVARSYTYKTTQGGIQISGQATVGFVTYPQTLLRLAAQLLNDGEPSVAVVVALMGAEIAGDRSLSEAFDERGIAELEEVISAFISGSVLANDRARKLLGELTGIDITVQPFWQDYVESAKLRNKISHKGLIATPDQATRAIEACSAIVKFLGKWGQPA